MKTLLVGSLCFAASFIAGCANDIDSNAIAQLQSRIESANKAIDALQTQGAVLKGDIDKLQADNNLRTFGEAFSGIAYLTPAEEGYSIIKTDIGYLTVHLANVQPYANGSRVTLIFGNPLAADLTGVKFTLEWGKVDSNGDPDNANVRSRDQTLVQSLTAGSWTSVPLVLDGVPASQLGFVRLKNIAHTGMSMRR